MPSWDTIRKFWNNVALGDPSDCWTWTGGLTFSLKGNKLKPSRIVYLLTHGVPPPGTLDHSCHNDDCCNPSHLLCRDGGHARGERNGRHKLTDDLVRQVRALKKKGWVQTRIANHLNTTQSTVSKILSRKLWSHL